MKVSWKWMSQLIDLKNIEFYELTEKLTLAGFEIEEIYELPEIEDRIIDLKITANRQDASCLIGLAREIGTILKKPLKNYDKNTYKISNNQNTLYQSLDDLKIDIITNIQNRPSPKWLHNYLRCYNIQTKNILNDIVEYIKIKWGQDIEVFDAQKIDTIPISNNNLIIDNTGNINQIIPNKNASYNINPELLKYKNIILSVIGIQSNKNIACDLNTSSIILCSTICKPKYIQSITKQLHIKTEKSIKHLKQILRCDFLYAYQEAIKLISTFAQGTIGKSYEYHSFQNIEPHILINKSTIYNILGPINNQSNRFLSVQEILKILNQLKFKSTYNHIKQIFKVAIPKYRTNDIKRPIDVIEEIGRIYGFEKFNDNLPETVVKGNISNETKTIKKIRQILRDLGMHEVIHFSLKKQHRHKEENKNNIYLFNPLTEDQARLQDNLITNLVEIQQYNINQKNFNIEAFEVGRIFIQDKTSINSIKNKKEDICIACIMGKSNFSRQSWADKPKELGWFQAKGILEEFFEKLQVKVGWKIFKAANTSIINKELAHLFHQKRTCIIYNPITKQEIGLFGQLHCKHNYYSYPNYATYIFEIRLKSLIQTINNIDHLNYRIKPYSPYPSVTRDISIKLNNNEYIDIIRQKILNQNNSLIESVEIFNEYKHVNSNDNRNIGLRITYRANNRTLNDTDLIKIDEEIKYLLSANIT